MGISNKISNKKKRVRIAKRTLQVLEDGYYINPEGEEVQIEDDLAYAKENTRYYPPEDLEGGEQNQKKMNSSQESETTVDVIGEPTLKVARRLTRLEEGSPFVLNFADAKKPGGLFLEGAGAQEESLARKSALYPCISQVDEYYERNKNCGTRLYTDGMIYSPDVPVFRKAGGVFLDSPFKVSFLTAPAVNRGVLEKRTPEKVSEAKSVMAGRIRKLLAIAAREGHKHLVLGAWGCGVFKNPPGQISKLFYDQLFSEEEFHGEFSQVMFAVLDKPGEKNFEIFQRNLEKVRSTA